MIYKERLFKILQFPHISEKTSVISKINNVVVFKVARYATKIDVKNAITMLFLVKVHSVNTIVIKGKIKGSAKNVGYRSNWKKAYVLLAQGQKINFFNKIK